MKKILKVSLVALIILLAAPIGCIKTDTNTPNPANILPDVANFTIEAVSTWVKGAATTISIISSTLGSGTFTVNFDLTGANSMTGLTATLTMNGSTGTFQTPVLSNSGEMNVVIRSIKNSSGGSSTVTHNNTYSFSDSTGLVNGTIGGASYRATDVRATLTGDLLSIHAVKWDPLTTVTLYVHNYANAPKTINFNSTNSTSFLGSAGYTAPGKAELSHHGTISVINTSPLVTGTFTFTCGDSSVVTGTFSCPKP